MRYPFLEMYHSSLRPSTQKPEEEKKMKEGREGEKERRIKGGREGGREEEKKK